MKLHIVSDLHLEFGDLQLPGGKLLIIAGDMCEAASFGRNDGRGRNIARAIKRFLKEELDKYEHVVFVPGNHEYYNRSLNETHRLLFNNLPKHVNVLQASSCRVDDVQFVGATLWTDMNGNDPVTERVVGHGMNDFRCITDFSVHAAKQEHKKHKAAIEEFVKLCPLDKVIVVTHHAPSFKSVNTRFEGEVYLNGGYASGLEDVMILNPNIKLWVHGHMHDESDYMIEDTRVVCNPRGYLGYEPRARNYAPKEVEV